MSDGDTDNDTTRGTTSGSASDDLRSARVDLTEENDVTAGAAAAGLTWRELLELRRFGVARHAYLLELSTTPGAPAGDEPTRAALSALADVEDLVRERSYLKAKTRIQRMEARAALAPWEAILADLDALAVTAKALDKREPEAALTGLEPLTASWLLAEVITQRGTAQIYLGELAEAQENFAAALEVDPQHYRALTNLGNVALEEGRVDDAIEFYERAIKLNDQFANAHHNLGVAYRRKGHLSKSVRSLRKAQRVAQRQETTQARESISQWSGARSSKVIKWLIYAVIGAVLVWFLRSRGYI